MATELAQKIKACPPELPRAPLLIHQRCITNIPCQFHSWELIGHKCLDSQTSSSSVRGLILVPSVLMDNTLPKPTMEKIVNYVRTYQLLDVQKLITQNSSGVHKPKLYQTPLLMLKHLQSRPCFQIFIAYCILLVHYRGLRIFCNTAPQKSNSKSLTHT